VHHEYGRLTVATAGLLCDVTRHKEAPTGQKNVSLLSDILWPVGGYESLIDSSRYCELFDGLFQRARLARLQMNHTMALTSFIESKRRAGLKSFQPVNTEQTATDGREEMFGENPVQQQYNHLLSCLEHTTVSAACPLCISRQKLKRVCMANPSQIYGASPAI